VTPLPVFIYRGFLPINLQLIRPSKTAIPLRDRLQIPSGIFAWGGSGNIGEWKKNIYSILWTRFFRFSNAFSERPLPREGWVDGAMQNSLRVCKFSQPCQERSAIWNFHMASNQSRCQGDKHTWGICRDGSS
jgi:hypothetical protein